MPSKYNIPQLTFECFAIAATFWEFARKAYAKHNVDIGEMPEIVMNPRLTATAGRAWTDCNKVDLSCYLYEQNKQHFLYDTIPHELCHIIATKIHGSKGHDKAWYATVKFLNVKTSRCHDLKTMAQAKKK
jgi:predicted SprT family Zn-dependent metalloprotease